MLTFSRDSAAAVRLEQRLLWGVAAMPISTRSALKALSLTTTGDRTPREIAEAAEADPLLLARLLSAANASALGRGSAVSDARVAIARLGREGTRDLLLAVAYGRPRGDVGTLDEALEQERIHGVITGQVARELARQVGVDPHDAFAAGALHDIGRIRCWCMLGPSSPSDRALLAPVVEEAHAVAGALLALEWGLPRNVEDTCRHHHEPGERALVCLVSVADMAAHVVMGDAPNRRRMADMAARIGVNVGDAILRARGARERVMGVTAPHPKEVEECPGS